MSKKIPPAEASDRKVPPARPSANLRLRLKDGRILARASANLDEFEVGVEIVEFLRILSAAPHLVGSPQKFSKALHDGLSAASRHVPPPHELPSLLQDMAAAGVLAAPNEKGAEGGFADPWIQWAMLADTRRVERYRQAIRHHTSSDTRAVDVGAGNGVLSAMLLGAGARHVLAVEESAAAQALRRTIKPNERFEVFSGHSRDAHIAPDTTLIVSELFGHDPFSEGVLETLRDIQGRLPLKPKLPQGKRGASSPKARHPREASRALGKTAGGSGVKSIPASVTVHWACAEIHSGPLCERLALWNAVVSGKTPGTAAAPRKPRSKETEAGGSFQIGGDLVRFAAAFHGAEDWSTLSFPFSLRPDEFTLQSPTKVALHVPLDQVPSAAELMQSRSSSLPVHAFAGESCVVIWFTSELAPGVHISSFPGSADSCAHWSPLILPFTSRLDPRIAELCLTARISECQTRLCCEVKQGGRVVAAR